MKDADQQRLNVIREKARRICGHKELSEKQSDTLAELLREQVTIKFGGVDEFINSLKKDTQ